MTGAATFALACGDPTVVYYRFTPMVVPQAGGVSVTLEVKTANAPSAVSLELASGGGPVSLVDDGSGVDAAAGDGIYSIALPASDVLYGFAADDVNRNFVGYLRLYQGGTQVGQWNLFVDVLTPDIPSVTIRNVSPSMQYSDHLVNVVDATFFTTKDLQQVAQAFYAHFPDAYDFLNIIYEVPHPANRNHFIIQNNVANIGIPLGGNPAAWGSAGRLLGRTEFPIPTMFDGASPAYAHELGHQWINALTVPPLNLAGPHWPLSDLAADIMGWGQGPNTQGLTFDFDLVPSGSDYLLVAKSGPKVYSDLSLYLIGLAPASEVGDHFVFDNQSQTPLAGGTLLGPVTTVSMSAVIAALGPRMPAYAAARKKFRMATILVSRDGLVSPEVMRHYDYFSARAEGTAAVSFADGFEKGLSNPFSPATQGRGVLDTRIMHRLLVDASRDGGVWWSPQAGPFDPAATHQGKLMADYLRSHGYRVDELPRPSTITSALLQPYDVVVRAVGFGGYTAAEIAAYQSYVQAGGRLLLLADHALHAPADGLAQSFGIQFAGVTRGANQLTSYAPHPITTGVGAFFYNVGSAVLAYPASAQIVGSLSAASYLDLNTNGVQDAGEPAAPHVLGVMTSGMGRIAFCGDTNLWETVPQPLVNNVLAWFEDP